MGADKLGSSSRRTVETTYERVVKPRCKFHHGPHPLRHLPGLSEDIDLTCSTAWYNCSRKRDRAVYHMELLKPKVDFVFKRIFGTEENRDILLDFVNSVFESAGEPPVASVDILNPNLDKSAVQDKQSILDIRAKSADGQYINVEIQLWNRTDIEKRTLFYWARMYSGQLEEGDSYRQLNKTVTINILDFDYIDVEKYHTTFHLHEDTTSWVLTDDIEIHFIELRKLKEQSVGTQRRLVRWMLFIAGLSRDAMEELAMEEPVFRKALTTLEFLSQDAESRRLYEERQKALRDEISAAESAREEGREVGRKEEQLHIARNLLSMGMSVADVVTATGLSEADILTLNKPH